VPLEVGNSASSSVVPTLISIPPPLELLPAKVLKRFSSIVSSTENSHTFVQPVFFDLAGNFLSMPDISGRVKKEGEFEEVECGA
jgi:hypothetical protein